MSAAGSISNSWRLAQARRDDILAVFAAEPGQAFSVEALWMKLRRVHARREIATTVGTLKSAGRLETVTASKMLGKTTYRLAREVKSA